ncbi:MAG: hypothetical protein PGN13_10300 [Patulibacter minatonensis]
MTEPRRPSGEELFNPELATAAWRRRLKASELGRIAAALYRRRRLPRQMLRAPGGLLQRDALAGVSQRRRVRTVVWIPAGPGALDGLLAAWESVVASSPGEVALLVTDDWSPDAHADAVRVHVPEALVVRTHVPSGGPPRLWPVTSLAVSWALRCFDFDHLVKFDTDALAVGPGWVEGIAQAIERAQATPPVTGPEDGDGSAARALSADVPIGIAGSFIERPDGHVETDRAYHRAVLAGEVPRDRQLAGWVARAEAGGWPAGSIVQGGCLVLTRAYAEALVAEGTLDYTPRLRTIVSEDLLLTVLAYAFGFRAASLGGPSGPLAIANKHLPLPLAELLDPGSRWLVAHSTKVGLDGEPESALRERAARARADWPAH